MVRRGAIHWPLALGIVLSAVALARAVDLSDAERLATLAEATRAFQRGADLRQVNPSEARAAFRTAAEQYQLLLDAGVRNGKLFYNLGNAYFESGDLGRAIANYRRAQEFIPGDGRLEHNLRYARSLRSNQIESTGQRAFWKTLFFWHYQSAFRTRIVLGLTLYVAFWLLLIVRNFAPRAGWRWLLIPALALWVALGISVTVDLLAAQQHHEGVIIANNVIVRKGNGDGYEPQFKQKLHEGVEFVVRERQPEWLLIELPDGKTGWIRNDQVELIQG